MAEVRELWVWMNGERVGTWQRTRTGGHRFVYEPSWIASPRVRPLSLSLPLTPDRTVAGPVVAHYFDNLLPDEDVYKRQVLEDDPVAVAGRQPGHRLLVDGVQIQPGFHTGFDAGAKVGDEAACAGQPGGHLLGRGQRSATPRHQLGGLQCADVVQRLSLIHI